MKQKTDYLEILRQGGALSFRQQCSMIIRLSIPGILAQVSTIIMQYIDASMVGMLGAGGSAAIGIVASTTWLYGGIAMALGMGFTVQCAQRIGAGKLSEARNLVRLGLLVTGLVTALMGVVGMLAAYALPGWLGADAAIRKDAGDYFFVFCLFFVVDRLNFLAGGFLQAAGNMRTPGILHVVMCILDVIFNAVLIFPQITLFGQVTIPGLNLGVKGAALGTGFAKLVSFGIMLYWLYQKPGVLDMPSRGKLQLRWDQIRKGIRIAIPIAAENVALNSAQIISTRIIAPLGTIAVAAHSLSITAESLCYMPGYGVSSAATAVIGQSIGAGRKRLTKRLGWICTGLGICLMSVCGVLLYVCAPWMLAFLSSDPAVIALGTKVLRIEAFAEPMFAASIVATGVTRGGGDTLIPALLGLFSMWAVRVPLSYLLAQRMGLPGAWLAMTIELWVRGILFLLRQAQGKYIRDV